MIQKTILVSSSRQNSSFARNLLIKKENIEYSFQEFTPEEPGVKRYFDLKRCQGSYIVKVSSNLIMDWLEFSDENDIVVLEQRDLLEAFTSWVLAKSVPPKYRNTKKFFTQRYKVENQKQSSEHIKKVYNDYLLHYESMSKFSKYMYSNKNVRLRFLPQTTLANYSLEWKGVEKIWDSVDQKLEYISDQQLLFDCIEELKPLHNRCVNELSILDYDEIIL